LRHSVHLIYIVPDFTDSSLQINSVESEIYIF